MRLKSLGMKMLIIMCLAVKGKGDQKTDKLLNSHSIIKTDNTGAKYNLLKNGVALNKNPFLAFHVIQEMMSSVTISVFPDIIDFDQNENNRCFKSLSRKNLTEKSIHAMNNLIGEFYGSIDISDSFPENERKLFNNILLLRDNEKELDFLTVYWVYKDHASHLFDDNDIMKEFTKELSDRNSNTNMQIVEGCDRRRNPQSKFLIRLSFKECPNEIIIQYKKTVFGFVKWTLYWNKTDKKLWANQKDHPQKFIFTDNRQSDFVVFGIPKEWQTTNEKEIIIDIGFYFSDDVDYEKTFSERTIKNTNPGLSQKFSELCLKFGIEEIYGLVINDHEHSRGRRDLMSNLGVTLTLVNYIFDGMNAYRMDNELNDLKNSIADNKLLDLKLAKITSQSLEAINDNKHRLMTLQKQECVSEIELESIRFDDYIKSSVEFFIMRVEDIKIQIASQLPNSLIQKYLILLCSEKNKLEIGCAHWFHRGHYELESIKTIHKFLDSKQGIQLGIQFSVKFILPILSQIKTVYEIIKVPVPLKHDESGYYYLHYATPNYIGIADSTNKAYPLDECLQIDFLGTRFCSTDLIYASQDKIDCSTALLDNKVHNFCETSVFKSNHDCLFASKADMKDILVSHFVKFEIFKDKDNYLPNLEHITTKKEMLEVSILMKETHEMTIYCEKSRFRVLPLSNNQSKSLEIVLPKIELEDHLTLETVDENNFWSFENMDQMVFLNGSMATDLISQYQSEVDRKILKTRSIYSKLFSWIPKNVIITAGIVLGIVAITGIIIIAKKYSWIFDCLKIIGDAIWTTLKFLWACLKNVATFIIWLGKKLVCECKCFRSRNNKEESSISVPLRPKRPKNGPFKGAKLEIREGSDEDSKRPHISIDLPHSSQPQNFERTANRKSFFR